MKIELINLTHENSRGTEYIQLQNNKPVGKWKVWKKSCDHQYSRSDYKCVFCGKEFE